MSERGEQPSNEGQAGNQHQQVGGAAQPQGQAARQPAAGAGQEGIGDILQRPGPKSYMQGIIGSMSIVGALLGVGVFLVAEMGGRSLMPGAASAVSGEQVNTALTFTHKLTLAYVTNELAIFLAFLMAPLFGALVALRMDDTFRAKLATSGVGVGVGALAFTVIVAFIASMVVPSVPQSLAAASAGSFGAAGTSVDLGSVEFGNLIINGIMIGITAGVAASATAYMVEENL